MALLRNYTFDTDFTDVYTIQANGQVLDPTTAINGISGRLEIGDWGGLIGKSLRVTLYETDPPTAGATSYRSEIAFPHYNKGEYWFRYEIYVPSTLPSVFDGTTSQVLLDPDADGVNDDPIFGGHLNESLLAVKTHADFVMHSGKQTNNPEIKLPRDRWVVIVVHTYWTDAGGFIEVTCDGQFAFRRWNSQTVHADAGRVYMKVGLYNYNKRTGYTMVRAYYRNVRFYDSDETWQSVTGSYPTVPWQPFTE